MIARDYDNRYFRIGYALDLREPFYQRPVCGGRPVKEIARMHNRIGFKLEYVINDTAERSVEIGFTAINAVLRNAVEFRVAEMRIRNMYYSATHEAILPFSVFKKAMLIRRRSRATIHSYSIAYRDISA